MNLRKAFPHIMANIEAGNAVILKGQPGLGKSDLMAKVASHIAALPQYAGKRIGLSTFFMATQSPIGFTGLPWKGELVIGENKYTITDPAMPQWYICTDLATGQRAPANLFDFVILVIEEWGQGDAETKRAGAEVLRAGGTPPWYLPPNNARIALTNTDPRDGVTKEFDFIIGRRTEITIDGDTDVWLEDFADKPYQWQGKTWQVMPVTKAWAKNNPTILFEPKPEKQGPWCTPRTLTAVDRYAQVLAGYNNGTIPHNDPGFMEGVSGQIGMAATMSFVSHLQFLIELPHLEDIVKDPTGTPVPTKADLQMLLAYELAGRCKVDNLAAVLQYIGRLPKDMSVTFVSSLLRRDYKSMINEPAMKAWVSKNAPLVAAIASLSQ